MRWDKELCGEETISEEVRRQERERARESDEDHEADVEKSEQERCIKRRSKLEVIVRRLLRVINRETEEEDPSVDSIS